MYGGPKGVGTVEHSIHTGSEAGKKQKETSQESLRAQMGGIKEVKKREGEEKRANSQNFGVPGTTILGEKKKKTTRGNPTLDPVLVHCLWGDFKREIFGGQTFKRRTVPNIVYKKKN